MTDMDKLCRILYEVLHVDPREIREDTTLATDLDADSLDLFQILRGIESHFHVSPNPAALCRVQTVGELLALIRVLEGGRAR